MRAWGARRPSGNRLENILSPVLSTKYWSPPLLTNSQEGWLAEHAVSEEDRLAAEQAQSAAGAREEDPMQGLEGLDVAGPKPE